MKTFPIINTERLILRQITLQDAPCLFEYFSKDEVTEFYDLASFTSIEQAISLVNLWNKRFAEDKATRWAVTLKETPEQMIGSCGFHNLSIENSRAEIGYELHPNFWRKGIISEAIQAIINYGFEQFNFHRIEAFIDPRNNASEKLLHKCGFKTEGHLRDYFFEKGRFVDALILSILKP